MTITTSSTVIPFISPTATRPLMSVVTAEDLLLLLQAHNQDPSLPYAGAILPAMAWAAANTGLATLVDIRTHEERVFVGRVPNTLHIAWATGTALNRNPRFLKELETKVGKDKIILLLCRSGRRSGEAATAATKAGFKYVFNVVEGFEGHLDENKQRGHKGGWRLAHLPWEQD